MFTQLLSALAETRHVIVELQAHRHTTDIDRPLSYEPMAILFALSMLRICPVCSIPTSWCFPTAIMRLYVVEYPNVLLSKLTAFPDAPMPKAE